MKITTIKKSINEIIFFPIILIFFIYFIKSINGNIVENIYSYNELFINYQSGFIRRGLLGEIFWLIQNFYKLSPVYFFSTIFFILYLIYIVFFYFLLKRIKNFIFVKILIIFSPVFLLFPIYDPNIYYIKDIFIKISIIAHGLIIIKYKLEFKKYIHLLHYYIIPSLGFLILFIHEYQALFICVHVLFSYYVGEENKIKNKYFIKNYIYLIIPFFFVILFVGNNNNLQHLNTILSNYNIQIHTQLGGGFKFYIGGFYKWYLYYFRYDDFINLFFSFIFSVGFLYYFFHYLIKEKVFLLNTKLKKNYIFFFLPTLVCFIAIDNGRNLSLISTHLLIFYLILDINYTKGKLLLNKFTNNFFYLNLFIIFFIFYIFLWKLDQFAGFGWGGKSFTIFKSSLVSEIIFFIKYIYYLIDKFIISLPMIKL
jgi:hypothetical protein